MQWLQVRISAGRALKERQCTLEGQAWHVNVQGSLHWKEVYKVEEWTSVQAECVKFLGLVKNRPLCSVIGDHVTCVAWRILRDERNARE